MATLTTPPVLVEPDERAVRAHRGDIITETVFWMQHDPARFTRFECTRSEAGPPHSIRAKFYVAHDLTAYSLRFPRAALGKATLWWDPYDRGHWQRLKTFDLSAFSSGQALAEDVIEFLDSDYMYDLHRGLDVD